VTLNFRIKDISMNKILKISTLCFCMATMLEANVSISSNSFQQKVQLSENGQKTKEWVKAEKIVPGTVIKYVNSLVNAGDKKASSLVIKNPIPKNMKYIANTAECKTVCKVTYSVDGGASFYSVGELYFTEESGKRLAKASEYTDIMWVVENLEAQTQSFVEYQAQLK
jgi:uncharacterized repeat protein (TIGR01451 family)